jgi:hypothetical protein
VWFWGGGVNNANNARGWGSEEAIGFLCPDVGMVSVVLVGGRGLSRAGMRVA